MSDLSLLYEDDFSAWTAQTIALLRQGRFADLDIEHLAEELNDMGKSGRYELVNRLRVLLAQLLKWQFQYRRLTARWAEIEGKGWRSAIIEQRAALSYLLDMNPGLRSVLADGIAEAYQQAVEMAAEETELPAAIFPADCPYDEGQVLGRGYYPPSE